MSHYTINSKNRKLKKQILGFLTRIGFGAGKLPISGRLILIFTAFLVCTLFFPWIELRFTDGSVQQYWAFSSYLGFIGFGVILGVIIMPFFLLSHRKKEKIRANIPFRLSDTQAVVFVASILFTALFQVLLMTSMHQMTMGDVYIHNSFLLALSFSVIIIVCGYFLSQKMKITNTDMYYLDHEHQNPLGEYQDLFSESNTGNKEKQKEKNMSLPI